MSENVEATTIDEVVADAAGERTRGKRQLLRLSRSLRLWPKSLRLTKS